MPVTRGVVKGGARGVVRGRSPATAPGGARATVKGGARAAGAGRVRRAAPARPGWVHERGMWAAGHRLVAGVDEVGRGAWAGPLTVGVAVLAEAPPRIPRNLRDSKQLPEEVRESIFEAVAAWCAAWAVGHAAPEECDRLGMTAALRLATRRAFGALPPDLLPDAVVLDGTFDYVSPPAEPTLFDVDGAPTATVGEPETPPTVKTVIGADARCATVAAASVLAKVTRDRLMRSTAEDYPPFDFERNKGYPSPAHQRALCGYGLTAVHRRSWAFVANLPWERTTWPGPYRLRADVADHAAADLGDDVGDDGEDDIADGSTGAGDDATADA